jgi:DNA-binding IclR family transcriptional regulator
MAGNVSAPGVSVTSRALSLLGAFDEQHRSLTLSEMARRAGLALATAHRLTEELVAWGALSRKESGRYVVGRRLWDLGLFAPVQTGLRQIASPFLHDIYAATLATVHLAVRDGTQVLYVDRLSGHASVPVVSQIGSRLPLYATGVGKVLLAHAPADMQQEVLGSLRRITPYTITQPGRLRAQRLLDRGAHPRPRRGGGGARHRRRRPAPRAGAAGYRAAGGGRGDRSQPGPVADGAFVQWKGLMVVGRPRVA